MNQVKPAPSLPEEESNALFRRVWARVMPEDRVDCPFLVIPAPEDAPETPAPPDSVPPDALRPAPAPGLGPQSAPSLPLLRELAGGKLELARTYRQLARRAGSGPTGRALAALAAGEERHARRLTAAAFLISGQRRAPAVPPARACPALPLGLRRSFQAEQRAQAVFLAAGEQTADPMLEELFRDIAREDGDHARTLLDLAARL